MEALDPEQRKVSNTILELFALAKKLKIVSATKLFQAARGKVDGASLKLAAAALEGNTGKQVFTPAPRSKGKTAAEGPGTVMQADLIDLSGNSRSKNLDLKYILMLQDVYTRQIDTQALKDKSSATVNEAFKEMLDQPANGKSVRITTDQGKEFSKLDKLMPGVIHTTKDTSAKNSIAVIDRTIQGFKRDIAMSIADEGGRWDSHYKDAEKAFNQKPNSHTIVPPDDVLENGVADFKVLQKSAKAFDINNNLTISRQKLLKDQGAFRIYTPNPRSFNQSFSDTVFNLKKIVNDKVFNTSGKSFLLQNVLAVPKGSTAAVGKLTDNTIPRKARFAERSLDIVNLLTEQGGQMSLVQFERLIRQGQGEGLIKVLRRNNMTIRGFLKLYPELFTVRLGVVKLKGQPAPPEPPPPEPPAPPPPPAAPARRRLTVIGDDAANSRVADALRKQKNAEKFLAIRRVYGSTPI